MRKTFCDRCGEECVNSVVHVHISETHTTNRAEVVGDDEYAPAELCHSCGDALKEFLPSLGRLLYRKEPIGEDEPQMARAIEAPYP